MSKQVLLSVLGLYNMDNTIFDSMQLPIGLNRETVIDAIIQDCMELEILYPNPDALKVMIGIWSKRELPTWNRVYNAEQAEYNPIENYDRHQNDTRQETHSGDDVTVTSNEGTSTDSTTGQSGTTTNATGRLSDDTLHKYAAFDSGTLADQTEDVKTASSTNTQTEQNTVEQSSRGTTSDSGRHTMTHGEKVGETFTSYIHGNIGVTTSQQMLESELTLAPKINTINYVVNSFKMRFCILVY